MVGFLMMCRERDEGVLLSQRSVLADIVLATVVRMKVEITGCELCLAYIVLGCGQNE